MPHFAAPLSSMVLAALVSVHAAGAAPASSPINRGAWQCSVSCDDQGRCMPLRFVWGAQKGGTTAMFSMLAQHMACGANKRFGYPAVPRTTKESHYLASLRRTEAPSRNTYTATYLLTECKSRCFVDGTPDNLLVPLAAARLHAMMSSAEAAQARFVVQLREPVSRHVSFFHMEIWLGKSHSSVQDRTARAVAEWAGHTRASAVAAAITVRMTAVRRCNAMDIEARKSTACASIATKAASLAAQLVAHCTKLPMIDGNQSHTAGAPVAVDNCRPPRYPPHVSWGMYAAQLHWLQTYFSRGQMLLLNMHTALSHSPNEYLQQILDHLQIPVTAHLHDVPHAKPATDAQAADILNCSTQAQLSAIYEPHNEILYAMEPEFDRFPPASDVPCQ